MIGLSVPAFVSSTTFASQVAPKSFDLATTMSLLRLSSHDAQTVRPSTGSTAICESQPGSPEAIGCGAAHVAPWSELTCRIWVGDWQAPQPGTPAYWA